MVKQLVKNKYNKNSPEDFKQFKKNKKEKDKPK